MTLQPSAEQKRKRRLGDPSKILGDPVENSGWPSGNLGVTQGSNWGKCLHLQQNCENTPAPQGVWTGRIPGRTDREHPWHCDRWQARFKSSAC